MSLSKETIKKLKAVKAAILAEPKLYDQNLSPYGKTDCNTPSCIAGWAVWIDNPNRAAYSDEVRYNMGLDLLKAHLGISYEQAYKLFEPNAWPEKFSDALQEELRGTPKAAEAAGKRIDLFIESGGAE